MKQLKLWVAIATVAMAAFAGAQATAVPGEIQGTPYAGERGKVVSVRDIMRLQANTPLREWISKDKEEEGPERVGLPQNPESPAVSQWPPLTSAARLSRSGPRVSGPSYFNVVSGWLGGGSLDTRFTPPDTMGDVSPTQVLVTINGRIKVYDRAGNLGALNADLDVFFNPVRNGAGISDPRCRWDRLTNRWIVLAINIASTNNRIVIGVSNGPTITDTSSFTFYQFSHNIGGNGTDEGRFLDYPSLGLDKNALYVGGNVFSSNGGFWNTSVHVIRKSSILNVGPIVVTPFRGMLDTNDGYLGMYTPQGVDNDDPNATAGYFIAIDGKTYGTLYARKVSNPGGTPILGPNLKLTVPTTSGPTDVPHLGSTNKLSAIDERLLVAKINRNALTGETSLWTSHHITTSSFGVAVNGGSTGGRTGVRWYEIRGYDTGTLSLRQSGTVFDSTVSNPNFFWMPSVVSTLQGHTVMGASRSSSLVYAGIGKTYRLAGDGLGFMNQPLKVVDGVDSFNIQSGTQRWGDYSHTVVDPADGMSVWTFQEYVSAKNQFGVRVLKLQAPPPATISSVSPNSSDAGKTVDLTVTGNTANGTGFFDPGAGYTGRLAAAFNGSGVTVSQVSFVSPSKITVTAVIGASAAGAYELTVTNPDGQTVKLASALTVNPAIALSGVSLPTTINAGSSVSGSVTLTAAAPTAGISVALPSRESGSLPAQFGRVVRRSFRGRERRWPPWLYVTSVGGRIQRFVRQGEASRGRWGSRR